MPNPPYRAIFSFIISVEGIESLAKAIGLRKDQLIAPNSSIERAITEYYYYRYPDNILYFGDIHKFGEDKWLLWSEYKKFVYMQEGLIEFHTINEVMNSMNMWDYTFFKLLKSKRFRVNNINSFTDFTVKKCAKSFINALDGTIYPVSYIYYEYDMVFDDYQKEGTTTISRLQYMKENDTLLEGIEELMISFKNLTHSHTPHHVDISLHIEFPLVSERYVSYKIRGETDVPKLRKNVDN